MPPIEPRSAEPARSWAWPKRYEVRSQLASGGFGIILRAFDREAGHDVAVKVPRPVAVDPSHLDRFRREAAIVSTLRHENVLRALASDTSGEVFLPHFVTELIHGVTLHHRMIHDGRMAFEEIAQVGAQLTEALAAIHRAEVVHNDIKPTNVMVDPNGKVTVIDFGLAVAATEPAPRQAVGSWAYQAPEALDALLTRHRGDPTTAPTPSTAADVYAAGLVLHELTTGERVFDATSHEYQDVRAAAGKDVPRLSEARPGTPPAWDGVVARMTARDPADRPTAAEVAEEIRGIAPPPPGSGTASRTASVGLTPVSHDRSQSSAPAPRRSDESRTSPRVQHEPGKSAALKKDRTK
ncbi:serine/threonine protein kinase [Yinghuangia sp. ASG 101]|uniref:serine/threonine-protein kinase n=1 Tax=Yinghuangia sp. ASG 101 TaxID=2896848 RepID=UPI001E382F31|nr:serine/threonine-protein kinase [Yinghuangia sp. ASG 101]UGQ15107.1 serine/threonine protein kinase [Yinghuangia sp. ASG 101]